jgi:hypothetical protein
VPIIVEAVPKLVNTDNAMLTALLASVVGPLGFGHIALKASGWQVNQKGVDKKYLSVEIFDFLD